MISKDIEEHKKNTLISTGSICGMALATTFWYFFTPFPLIIISLWLVFIIALYTGRAIIFK